MNYLITVKQIFMKKTNPFYYLTATLLLLSVAFIACNKESASETGIVSPPPGKSELKIMLTDDPSTIFDSVFIDIQKVEVKVEMSNGSEHWDTLSIRAGVYNILRFRNGLDTLLAGGYVPNGEIQKIRVTLGNNNAAILQGVTVPLFLHHNQITVNIDGDVDHLDPNHLRLWLDFDGHGSIRFHNGRFELDLRIGHFSHHNSGELEGKIKPSAAFPVMVKAISGTDTLIAIPEHEGEFKIRGIRSSTVKLIITPSNGYRDSVINNIQIRRGDDTKLGTIVLHQ